MKTPDINLEQLWRDYARCWSLTPEARPEALRRCVVDTVSYQDPQQEASGIDALARAMESFAAQVPGHHFSIGEVAFHHGQSLAEWRLLSGAGALKMLGKSVAAHAEDGRLLRITGFPGRLRSNPRVVMLVTSHAELGGSGHPTGAWLEELAAPYWAFVDAGCDVVLASPKGGEGPIDPASRAEAMRTAAVQRFEEDGPALGKLKQTAKLSEIEAEVFDAVFLVGGHGTMWDFPDEPALGRLLERSAERGAVIASVCHGAAGLLAAPPSAGLVAGRALTGFSDLEEAQVGLSEVVPFLLEARLRAAGARHSSGGPFGVHVVRDGQLVTGQNPSSSGACARAALAALAERKPGDLLGA